MRKDELLIKEVYEYTIDKRTYKGSCKILKVVKVVETSKDIWNNSQILVLENGQELNKGRIYDLNRALDSRNYADFDDYLRHYKQVFTIEKVPNIKAIFKQIKECEITLLTANIKSIKSDISKHEKTVKDLNKRLEDLNNVLKILEGD